MTSRSERTKWGLCFGLMAAFVVAGTGVSITARSADATPPNQPVIGQSPTPTPAGDQAAAGRQRFDHVCGRCHPNGNEDVGPAIRNKNFDEAKMVKQIRNGVGRMRAIPPTKLSDADMPALMTYLRTLHTVR